MSDGCSTPAAVLGTLCTTHLDPSALFGGTDELLRADRALFGMGPARQRLGAADPPRAQIELRLERDPHFAIVDRLVELTEEGQPPIGVFRPLGVMIFPFEPFVRSQAKMPSSPWKMMWSCAPTVSRWTICSTSARSLLPATAAASCE